VAEEGAEVGAVGVEAKARDLLHSSRLAGASTLGYAITSVLSKCYRPL